MQNPSSPDTASEKDVDEAIKETFPASDPPSFMSGSTAAPTRETLESAAREAQHDSTVTIYRVVGEGQVAKPFGSSTTTGGRWTSDGTPAVYASHSPATALLEFLVHCEGTPAETAFLASARIPRDRITPLTSYPSGWDERPYRDEVRRVGDEWARSHQSLALQVPSALCDDACNVILNPEHVDAPLLQSIEVRPIRIDERLRRVAAG
jgi:RES domain-containing protein